MSPAETDTTQRRARKKQLKLKFGENGKCVGEKARKRMSDILDAVCLQPGVTRGMMQILKAIDNRARYDKTWKGTYSDIAKDVGWKSCRSVTRWMPQLTGPSFLDAEPTDEKRYNPHLRKWEVVYSFAITWNELVELIVGTKSIKPTEKSDKKVVPVSGHFVTNPGQNVPVSRQNVHRTSLYPSNPPPPPATTPAASPAQLEREPQEGEAEVVGRIRKKLDAPQKPLARVASGDLPIDKAARILDRAERENVSPGVLYYWLTDDTVDHSRSSPSRAQTEKARSDLRYKNEYLCDRWGPTVESLSEAEQLRLAEYARDVMNNQTAYDWFRRDGMNQTHMSAYVRAYLAIHKPKQETKP